jgi:protein-S-isoprenylcysteine O-methyltransferase Ste14
MKAALGALYGLVVYVCFVGAFLYLIAFVGNVLVPRSVDIGPSSPAGMALAIDVALFVLFGFQHSVMARRSFKERWTRIIPRSLERSTFVLAATACVALLMWQWRPIPQPIVWQVESPIGVTLLRALSLAGFGLALLSTVLINHFELFGLRQVWVRLRGREVPTGRFVTPLLYRYVRHPLYLGFIVGFWATPVMTAGHLLFASLGTLYILIGIAFEERDLIAQYGARYRAYREQVPMLLPRPARFPEAGTTVREG